MIYINKNYRLVNDYKSFALQEKRVNTKGKNKGEEAWRTICYPSTFENALTAYFKHRNMSFLKDNEIAAEETLKTLKHEWNKYLKEIKEVARIHKNVEVKY